MSARIAAPPADHSLLPADARNCLRIAASALNAIRRVTGITLQERQAFPFARIGFTDHFLTAFGK